MMMDDYKSSDNFNGVEGSKLMSPRHSHPTNGVGPVDSNYFNWAESWADRLGEDRISFPEEWLLE